MKSKMASLVGATLVVALTLTACGSGSGSENASSAGSAEHGVDRRRPTRTRRSRSARSTSRRTSTTRPGGGQGVTEAFNGNVYEGLFKLTDDGKVEKLLAEDYKVSDDGLTYTFTLRSGVTFHSGKPLTSADVKYSIEKVIAEDSQSARKSSFRDHQHHRDAGRLARCVSSSRAKSISLVYNLSYVWIVNAEAKDLTTTEDGTGPYTLGDVEARLRAQP